MEKEDQDVNVWDEGNGYFFRKVAPDENRACAAGRMEYDVDDDGYTVRVPIVCRPCRCGVLTPIRDDDVTDR